MVSLSKSVRHSDFNQPILILSKIGWFPVDISMNQPNGVKTGEMINRFLNEFPALRALVLIIKAFLNQRSMNEVYSGGLGSYAIVCLAVSFLQVSGLKSMYNPFYY